MRPRYVVSSVTGHHISPSGASTHHPRTIWSVLDSALCYLPVTAVAVGNGSPTSYGELGERNMRALAAKLNALDLLGPAPPPEIYARNGR